ncbi:sensor histidine kinase [Amycolatopsis australiensis]|uniref:histidine kinase n=1 Tax=Amycolatopsis australiensis TaxID=546364 RepID=A0A1K1S1J8_9PSEU|nr:HAMP domain-containing sensor histidine kinase [Amycolatopsis australiensis]SFW78280.1 Signal transduction histidine kinase [Amycolatopsis australiensis]
MTESSTGRLRRLRRLLTLLFTVMNAAGLVVLALLVIKVDADRGRQQLDSEVRLVVAGVNRLLADSGGALVTAYITGDPLNEQCPQFAVLPGGTPRFAGYHSRRRCVPVDDAYLDGLAAQAVQAAHPLSGYSRTADGHLLYFAAEPIQNSGRQYIGAVVAVADTAGEEARHDQWVLLVLGGCALLVAAVGGLGYVLAGRATKPAEAALDQQRSLLNGVSQLLDGVVHDLKTPVARLRALADAAQRNPEAQAELLPRTIRLAGMMGDIIDLWPSRARITAGVEELTLAPLMLDQLVETLAEDIPADGARVTVTSVPTRVDGDATLLRRAIGNLIGNALDHGRLGGEDAEVQVTVLDGRVIVADRGPGIDPGEAAKLFEPHYSGGGSTGIGLAVVKWVAEVHGGTVRVYNRDEGGAIFELSLPTGR